MVNITPDMKTTESAQFAGGKAQFALTSKATGRTVYVKFEAKAGEPRAWKRGTVPVEDADRIFVSEKGYGTERIGQIYPNGRLYTERDNRDPHVWACGQILAFVQGNAPQETDQYRITAESTCCLCNMKLEDPVSVVRGIGPVCADKPTGTKILHAMSPQLKLKIEEVKKSMRVQTQTTRDTVVQDHVTTTTVQAADEQIDLGHKVEHAKRETLQEGAAYLREACEEAGCPESEIRKVKDAIDALNPLTTVCDGIREDENLTGQQVRTLCDLAKVLAKLAPYPKLAEMTREMAGTLW